MSMIHNRIARRFKAAALLTAGAALGASLTASAMTFTVGNVDAANGAQAVVPVQVSGLTSVNTFQFSFHYNTNVATLVGIEQVASSLPGFSVAGSFATNELGVIRVLWLEPNGDQASIADGVLFAVRLKLIGSPRSFSDLTIDGSPLPMEAYDVDLNEVPITPVPGKSTVLFKPRTIASTNLTWAPGATNYWEINKADATEGTDPGWNSIHDTGTLTINATSGNKFHLKLYSGTLGGLLGPVANLNPATSYVWPIVRANTAISGFDANAIDIDASAFVNDLKGGHFSLEQVGTTINLLFTANPPPIASPVVLYRGSLSAYRLQTSALMTNITDANGTPEFQGYLPPQSAIAGTLNLSAPGWVTYQPAQPDTDATVAFAYYVKDPAAVRPGDTQWYVTNTVTINRVGLGGVAQGAYVTSGGGPVKVKFAGVPGVQYQIQRRASLLSGDWATVITTNAPANGAFDFNDPNPPLPTAFYRLFCP